MTVIAEVAFTAAEALRVTVALRLPMALPLYSGTRVYFPATAPLKVAVYTPFWLPSFTGLNVSASAVRDAPSGIAIARASCDANPLNASPAAFFSVSVNVVSARLSATMASGVATRVDCAAAGAMSLMVTRAAGSVTPLTTGVSATTSPSFPAVTVTA